jgi:hypothetical protein
VAFVPAIEIVALTGVFQRDGIIGEIHRVVDGVFSRSSVKNQ